MSRFGSSKMKMIMFRRALLASVAMLPVALSTPEVVAQETSSAIRGVITSPDGSPLAGQTVIIRDTRTGTVKSVSTSNSGSYSARGLRVGGPYTVRVISQDYAGESVEGIVLRLGTIFEADIQLDVVVEGIEEVVVTASALNTASVAIGPSSTYDLTEIETAPAINRDIKDIIRQDPRIYIDESNSDAIQCVGANPRFNSVTVDGAAMNDSFGLNSNGYPTERIPFSFDAIQQVAVEMAPFDVEYGSFTGCNINAVFKSGSNEFHGSAFFDWTSDSLRGDSLEGDKFDVGDYTEKRYGATLGGPIIKDRLFFFAAYEKLEGAQLFDRGVEGSGAAREILGVTQAQLDAIVAASNNLYGFDPGGLPSSLPVTDEKIILKLDWNINDDHRAAFTYNYNDGFSISQSDNDDNELELSNHYYERGAELKSYTGQVFSDWADNFSTEIRVSYLDLDNRQISLIGAEVGEARITTSPGTYVYVGGDDSRQSNDMYYTVWNYKAAGTYVMGDHAITGGYERQDIEVFNLFVQHTSGEYRFDSVADYEAGTPSRLYYGNAPTLNPEDAGGAFKYAVSTLYLQDEFQIPDSGLNITAGVRFDWYGNKDLPTENQNFIDRNGYSNATNFDGRSVLQPRFGFTWDYSDSIRVHGGIGIYSGGNPNVWMTNNYQQDGITQIQIQLRDYDDDPAFTLFDDPTANGGQPISDVPIRAQDLVSSGSANAGVNALDPDFKIPTQLKASLGTVIDFNAGGFGRGFRFSLDALYSKTRNAATVIDATLEQIGTAPDGRPLYFSLDRSDAACVADPGSNPFGCNRWFNSDYILTNSKNGGRNYVISASLSNSHDNGIDWSVAYAYTDAKDTNPMTSSVAFSNYAGVVSSDRNNPLPATSNWEIAHRFTAKFSYEHDFWEDNTTRLSMFASLQSGRPFGFSFIDGGGAFAGGLDEFGDGIDGAHLLYIPTGPSDPNVVFDPGFDTTAFFAYLDQHDLTKYAGGIAPRNSNRSDWWGKIDLKFEQEFPSFAEGHKILAFLVIENFTNLINDDWGVMYHGGYFGNTSIVDARVDRAANQYLFNEFVARDPQSRRAAPSQWTIRIGARYKF